MNIWSDADLSAEAMSRLVLGLGNHRLVLSQARGNNLTAGGFSPELEDADIAFGQPDPGQILASKRLKWIQITSAGYTRYDTKQFRDHVAQSGLVFCNSSSVFSEPCAQHTLAFMLSQARQIPAAVIEQAEAKRWIFDKLRPGARILKGDKVLIVGYGAIAKRLIELLEPFGLEITALRRKPRGTELAPTFAIDRLSEYLPQADHVVNLLPASDSTKGLFNRDRLDLIKAGAVFYNIGRGTTVDQDALNEALVSGRLSGALLDVTDPEPLPAEHPLWSAPNCTITPHIAGGMASEQILLVEHFLENLRRFEARENLVDRLPF